MIEWQTPSFGPIPRLKNPVLFFPSRLPARGVTFTFASHVATEGLFSYGSFARPATTWRNGYCVLSEIVCRGAFWRFCNMCCFAGNICFRAAGWRSSCDEACFGLSKFGCARVIFDLHLIQRKGLSVTHTACGFFQAGRIRGLPRENTIFLQVQERTPFLLNACEFSLPVITCIVAQGTEITQNAFARRGYGTLKHNWKDYAMRL